jgi:phage terminase small subunit
MIGASLHERRKKMTLNRDQLKFVHHYVHNLDTKKAALHAGFTARYGHQLYDMPEVRAEIDERLKILRVEQARLKELHAMDRKKVESRRGLHKV